MLTWRADMAHALQLELSLDDLKRNFRKHTVVATIQCAGNRRNELNAGEAA